MSNQHRAVNWNRQKRIYDLCLGTGTPALVNGVVLGDPRPNPPGTMVAPVAVPLSRVTPEDPAPFYVGYVPKTDPPLARQTRLAVAGIGLVTSATMVTSALAQPPFAAAVFEYGRPHPVLGVIRAHPYPTLELTEGPRVIRYLLAASGKHGATMAAAPDDGMVVRVLGRLIRHGNASMLEVADIQPSESNSVSRAPLTQTDLGRFTLTGEIVDAKCWLGVMNPGEGKTHLDCAVRCISGGLPPMLVVRDAAGAERHLLLADVRGAPMPRSILRAVGRPVSIAGTVVQEGHLLFLRAEPSAVQLLRR